MLFRKKRDMIDVRELQRRGVVRIPKQDIVVPTNRDGFIEMGSGGSPTNTDAPTTNTPTTNTELFGFMDQTSSPAGTSITGRDESERITALDNKIYKLENRIELLEKKLEVNQPSEPSVGAMGW